MRICFGPFTLDPDTRQLTREGRSIHLSPKAFELLEALALERPNVLSKTVLQKRLWPETFVTEGNLSNLVAEVRDALDDSPRDPRTSGPCTSSATPSAATPPSCRGANEPRADEAVCWIEWGTRRFALHPGEHVVGRDPDVEVRLDALSVSRRHARLVVTAESTVLEDFGSKNGTYRGCDRVTSPIQLADGDEIRIGSQLVIVRLRPDDPMDTQTVDL